MIPLLLLIISTPVAILSKVFLFLQSENVNSLIAIIGHSSDSSLSYVKGCRSFNQHFIIYSFLDWEGHHWVFTTHTPNHSSALATKKLQYSFRLAVT